MSLRPLLSELLQLGVKFKLDDGGQLSISAPKGNLSDDLMSRLKQKKAQLIDWLMDQQSATAPQALPVIEPDFKNLYVPFAAADLQTAFLMGDSEDMEFHVRPHYYLERELDALDVTRFQQALNASLHRQRANLVVATQDLQVQTVSDFTPVQVKVLDLRNQPQILQQAALQATREEMSRQILPIDRWPWIDCRISLYSDKDAGYKARLHFNNNNVFSDGYGSFKLLSDTMHYYLNPDQPLPQLTLSFRDCALALQGLEESPLGAASQRYWLQRLPQLPGPPQIPLRLGVNRRSRSLLRRRELVLPETVWSAFKGHARHYGLTPTNALYAVYAELIAYWSGSRHFLLSNMVTHRFPMHAEVKEIIGNFASLYPLEVDWRGARPFNERARGLQSQIMVDLQHVYWSGVKVLQALNQVHKTPGLAPIPFVVGSGLFMQAQDEPYYGCLETPQVMLDHQFWELTDGRLWYVWDLIEQVFPQGMIDAMWDAYQTLLMRLAEDATAWSNVSFDLLPAAQRQQQAEANNTTCAVPQGLLQDALKQQAAKACERLAVVSTNRTLTYGELQACANALAHRLLVAGTRPKELIAVILNKGWEQVVAVYGALIAGAAYVPIDPQWPQDRIHYLLGNINAKRVLTCQSLLAALSLPSDIEALCVDESNSQTMTPILERPPTMQQDLAYVIFTSGSTGIPKGVMIDHRGALNTVIDINQRLGVTQSDVVFGISSLYFDLSVYDVFGTLAAGATLVLPSASGATAPEVWIATILTQQVTVWNSVPALMQLLVDAALADEVSLPSLRVVMLSGDWIGVQLPLQIRQVAPNARIISLGGATEASIWSIHYPIDRHDSNWVSVPYGYPLANQIWYIMDDCGNDTPTWVPGHLYIGGIGLALGYWQDRERTDAAFVQHPRSGERLYRTGDLGRYLPDGTIEFLGRSDFQVKIQGFRVELGEVEHALMAYPNVRAATAIAHATAAGKHLLGFIVLDAAVASVQIEHVQNYLRTKLPHYMVPAQIIVLEQLPLSANGKVDRQALVRMGTLVQAKARTTVAASTPMEKALVAIWEDVLDIHPVGIYDDFFDLGGQSFAALRMMTRIARQFGRRLPLSDLLQGRTIFHLTHRLDMAMRESGSWSPLVPMHINDANGHRPCFFVHPAGGNVLCYRGLAQSMGRPFYGLQAAGLADEQAALPQISQMAELYIRAIRQVQPCGPYLLGGWSSGGVIAFEMARQLECAGATVERIWMLDTPAPLQHEAIDDLKILSWFLEDLNIGFDAASTDLHSLVSLDPSQQFASALKLLEGRNTEGMDLSASHMEPIYKVFKAIIYACRDYSPSLIKAPISVLRAAQGQVSEFAEHPANDKPDWGWSSFTHSGVRNALVAGSHYTMLSQQHLGTLSETLNSQLEHG